MQILKYLFLLLILSFIGLTVYITTQKGDYAVTRSRIIKAPKMTVFEYVNDYKNWETFDIKKKEDVGIIFEYPAKTMGIGASYSWKSNNGDGFMKTVFVKENDSIAQKMTFDGMPSEVNWKFKDTIGGTKVTWSTKGNINLMTKITSFFKGGIQRVIGNSYEQSLVNLDKTLEYEMKTHSIKINGVTQRNAAFFLKQTYSCKQKSLIRNIKIVLPRMVYFFKKNNIQMVGKPFVIYNNIDYANDIVNFSVCIPTAEKVFLDTDSDMQSGEMEAFTCLKTTLTGDYSHLAETWKKAQKHITDNDFKQNFAGKYIEVYSKTIDDVKNPSKWITELYIPVFPKAVPVTLSVSTTSTTISAPRTETQPEQQETTPEENP
jgi:predicted transcriptional regulator YdeE